MKQGNRLLAIGCVGALLLGIMVFFGMTLPGVHSVSDSLSESPDSKVGNNVHVSPAESKTIEGNSQASPKLQGRAVPSASTNPLEEQFESWKETENLIFDKSCRLTSNSKIVELDQKITDLKRVASDSHPFDAPLASGFSDFQRNGRFYQFSLAQTGKQNEAGEELFRFMLTSAASSDTSSPFQQEKFDDQRYLKLVTQSEGRLLWDMYLSARRSEAKVKVSEVRYRSFVDSDENDMFEVSNSKLVGYSSPQLGCVNENSEKKLKCSCRLSFAD